jgi:hypothetical protein
MQQRREGLPYLVLFMFSVIYEVKFYESATGVLFI